jgi:hypothetical protein
MTAFGQLVKVVTGVQNSAGQLVGGTRCNRGGKIACPLRVTPAARGSIPELRKPGATIATPGESFCHRRPHEPGVHAEHPNTAVVHLIRQGFGQSGDAGLGYREGRDVGGSSIAEVAINGDQSTGSPSAHSSQHRPGGQHRAQQVDRDSLPPQLGVTLRSRA